MVLVGPDDQEGGMVLLITIGSYVLIDIPICNGFSQKKPFKVGDIF